MPSFSTWEMAGQQILLPLLSGLWDHLFPGPGSQDAPGQLYSPFPPAFVGS